MLSSLSSLASGWRHHRLLRGAMWTSLCNFDAGGIATSNQAAAGSERPQPAHVMTAATRRVARQRRTVQAHSTAVDQQCAALLSSPSLPQHLQMHARGLSTIVTAAVASKGTSRRSSARRCRAGRHWRTPSMGRICLPGKLSRLGRHSLRLCRMSAARSSSMQPSACRPRHQACTV